MSNMDSAGYRAIAGNLGSRGFEIVESWTLVGLVSDSERLSLFAGGALTLAACLGLAWRHLPWAAVVCGSTVIASQLATEALKLVIARQGPPLTPWIATAHSFPSGTAAFVSALSASLAYVAYHRVRFTPIRRSVLALLCGTWAAEMMSCLTYHFASEVLGGVVVAALCFATIQLVAWPHVRPELFPGRKQIGARPRLTNRARPGNI